MDAHRRRGLRPRWAVVGLAWAVAGCTLVGYPSGRPGDDIAPVPDRVVTADVGSEGRGRTVPDADLVHATAAGGASDDGGAGKVYEVFGETYTVLPSARGYRERGVASWYGKEFQGRPTASGEPFDMNRLSAAHRTLPLDTWVEVTNLDNGRTLVVRINDRGPFASPHERIIDLSYAAARQLGIVGPGTARVEVRALAPDELRGQDLP